jgi:hypothetical protein
MGLFRDFKKFSLVLETLFDARPILSTDANQAKPQYTRVCMSPEFESAVLDFWMISSIKGVLCDTSPEQKTLDCCTHEIVMPFIELVHFK